MIAVMTTSASKAAAGSVGTVETHVRARFLAEWLPALAALGPPDEVRLVFWVDG